jgi:two-component system sensor histidine kinase/response regulator
MNDHIGKPVNPAMLYETLLRWLDEPGAPVAPVSADPPRPSAQLSPPDVLAPVESLDTVRGLSLFAGQRALYVQALRYFVDLYGAGLGAVDNYLAGAPTASRAAVGREIHSMGGAAAALGATGLEAAAHRVEAMLRPDRGQPPAEAELAAELESVRGGVAKLVRELRLVLPAIPAPVAGER